MTRRLSPGKKLLIIVAVQCLVLLSVIGFKQYTIWTAETVLLKVAPMDPRDLARTNPSAVSYEISTIDLASVAGDDVYGGPLWVELQRGDDGYWHAVAVHWRRERALAGTVLVQGQAQPSGAPGSSIHVRYGIEQVFVPDGSAASLPSGQQHAIAVDVRVDRFGNAAPRRFKVDGQPFELQRR